MSRRAVALPLLWALGFGAPVPVRGHDLAEIASATAEARTAGQELLAAAAATEVPAHHRQALRDRIAEQERHDQAFLEAYWQGRRGYSDRTEKAFSNEEIRIDLKDLLEPALDRDEALRRALDAYAEARRQALQGAMGPGACGFHLWARIERLDDAPEATGARVRLGNRSPACRNAGASIALRSVRWLGAEAEPVPWQGPLPGVSVALEDGSIEVTSAAAIAHTLDRVPRTDASFERGFLRPGDDLEIYLWNPPRHDDHYVLEVELVVVEPSLLDGAVLLPERSAEFTTRYRRGERGADPDLAGLAFVPWKKEALPETLRLVRPMPSHAASP